MNKIKVLVEGYAYEGTNNNFFASPTTTLIYSDDKKILVDPGTNADKLLVTLETEGLKTTDIDIVYISHYHPDHWLNVRLFPESEIYDGGILWKGDEEIFHTGTIPGTDIEVLPTPGHSPEHTSLLVTTEDLGLVCIAQDVFWWIDGEQKSDSEIDLMNLEDAFASDIEALQVSRKTVLGRADWIIPGHGRIFKNPSRSGEIKN